MMQRRNWIKIYVDQCLRGTMMKEIPYDERWVWIGLLLLAGDSPFEGKIAISETIGYTDEQIAGLLETPVDIYISAKEKLIKHDKISVNENGIIKITNWRKYQSEYGRLRKYREPHKSTKNSTPKSTPKSHAEREIEKEKENKKELVISKDIDIPLSTKTLTQLEFSSPIETIKLQWNEFAKEFDLPQIKNIEKKSARSGSLKARMKENGFCFTDLLETIKNSPLLLGQTKENFRVFFDWIIKPINYQKIIEGTYLGKKKETYKEYMERKRIEEGEI